MGLKAQALRWLVRLERFTDRAWYVPLLSAFAALDFFVLVVPTDALLLSYVALKPRRWVSAGFWIATGSALGALLMAVLIARFGEPMVALFAPEPEKWARAVSLVREYGIWGLVGLAIGPIPLQPGVVVAAAAKMPLGAIFFPIWGARLLKYFVLSYAATHAPEVLANLWGVRREIRELTKAESDLHGKT